MDQDSTQLPTEPNKDFETVLVAVDELQRLPPGKIPNAELAAVADLGVRSFNARTQVVQWGKYNGQDAALLVFALSFDYKAESLRRLTRAEIILSFVEIPDHPGQETDLKNAPIVREIEPHRWEVNSSEESKEPVKLRIDPELTIMDVGIRIGSIDMSVNRKPHKYSVRLDVTSKASKGQTNHIDEAKWTVANTGSKDIGIVRDFRIALVVEAPRNPTSRFCAYMLIEATAGTGIVGQITRTLRSENELPILLDRKTPKPEGKPLSYGAVDQDFSDPTFPWHELKLVPSEEIVSPPKL